MSNKPSHACPQCSGLGGYGVLPDGEGYAESCGECRGKGAFFCSDPLCNLCADIREELETFRIGGHNATALACMALAKRYRMTVREARELLEEASEVRP